MQKYFFWFPEHNLCWLDDMTLKLLTHSEMGCLFTENWNSDPYCLSKAGCRQFQIVFLSLNHLPNNVFLQEVLASANHTKYVCAANSEACCGSGALSFLWSIKNFLFLHFLFSEERSRIDWTSSGETCGLWARLGCAEASPLHLLAIGSWTENPFLRLLWSGKSQGLVVEGIADSLERNSWAMALIAVLTCSQVILGCFTSQSCVTRRRQAWKDSNNFEIG